ncbi:MAG: alpha/beta hydrolase [Polyangiaceae bacterium]|nr:alpha/beta hydrolase [Polyangiaceae bacterium]
MDFTPDSLSGHEQLKLSLPEEQDGPLEATLVRRTEYRGAKGSEARAAYERRPALLWIHGFIDYYFQDWLAAALENSGFAFYALDLRRAGRSLKKENLPYFARNVREYFPEIDWALGEITERHSVAGLMAHSTGGLIATHYSLFGAQRHTYGKLLLNSPLLALRATRFQKLLLKLLSPAGQILPRLTAPIGLNHIYGSTLHHSVQGEWEYNLDWKPIAGFPVYLGWLSMVNQATAHWGNCPPVEQKVLLLCSQSWHAPGKVIRNRDFHADTILSSDDMRRIAPKLGPLVQVESLDGALHDVFLSEQKVREEALKLSLAFLHDSAGSI